MKTKLKLYRVTLAWARNDAEQGDFCEMVWAKDDDAAVKELAGRMADSQDLTGRARKEAIDQWIADAGYAADDVSLSIKHDVSALLAGPGGAPSKQAVHAQRVIEDLLALYAGII